MARILQRARQPARRARRAVAALARLRGRDLLTLAHGLAVLCGVELAIRWVPLPRLAGLLGAPLDLSPDDPAPDRPPPALDERAWRRVALLRRLARLWPWGAGPCLRESLVIGHALRRWDPVLRLGVAGRDGRISAHAWLEVAGAPLYGADGFAVFADRAGRP